MRRYRAGEPAGEVLWSREQLLEQGRGARVAIAEERLQGPLAALAPELTAITAADALPLASEAFASGAADPALADANYVRSEQQIYGKTPGAATA